VKVTIVGVTDVGVKGTSPINTTASGMKPEPLIVTVVSGDPITIELGETEVILGAGLGLGTSGVENTSP
jgi:hypothetical protein